MVGIPGKRTTGCHTCRRRKIKCDRTEPDCLRCLRAGYTCEGYERGLVFLNRTAKGLDRRKYLDDTRPRNPSASVARKTSPVVGSLGLSMNLSPSLDHAIRGFFIDYWLACQDPHVVPVGEWLVRSYALSNPGPTLEKSLAALSITTIGELRDDLAMVQHGRSLYGKALHSLQLALWDPEQVMQEQTVAAVQAMKMYEIVQSTQGSVASLDKHVYGAVRLLIHRGPYFNPTAYNQALIRDIRYSAMAIALQYRRRNPLGGDEWRTSVWTSSRDVESSLIDIGFDIAGVAEDIDAALRCSSPEQMTKQVEEVLLRALALGDALQQWHTDAIRLNWLSADWPHPKLDQMPARAETFAERCATVDLPTLQQSFILLEFWSLKLVVAILIYATSSRVPVDLPISPESGDYSVDFQIRMAKNIYTTVRYQSREEHGFTASSRCTLSTRIGLFPLRMYPSEETAEILKDAEDIIEDLSTRRGNRYLGALKNVSGEWRDVPA